MNKVTIFKYEENKPVRIMNINGEPWFVLKDVCEVLGMDSTQLKKVADRLEEDEKGAYSDYDPRRSTGELDYQRVRPVQRHPAQR